MSYEILCYLKPIQTALLLGFSAYKAVKRLINRVERDKTMALTCAAVAALAFPFFGISGVLTSLSAFSGYSLAKDGSYFYHPSIQKRELTEEEKGKLRSLAKDPSIQRVSWAYNETNRSWDPIYIQKAFHNTRTLYSAYNSNKEQIGEAAIVINSSQDKGYGINSGPYCFLIGLNTKGFEIKPPQQYKYIGYLLVKAVEEDTRSITHGRISLKAVEDAVPFYEKLGFETRFIEGKGFSQMILPESTANKWGTYSPFSIPSENL